MSKLEFKEGQTYVCQKSFTTYWVEGKGYETKYDEISGKYAIIDEYGFYYFDWEINHSRIKFTLKEETIMRQQLQVLVNGNWIDVSMLDYARGIVVVCTLETEIFDIKTVELRLKEE